MARKQRPTLPYHKDYGMTHESRLAAIADAKKMSTTDAAARHHVHPTTLRRWLRDHRKHNLEK